MLTGATQRDVLFHLVHSGLPGPLRVELRLRLPSVGWENTKGILCAPGVPHKLGPVGDHSVAQLDNGRMASVSVLSHQDLEPLVPANLIECTFNLNLIIHVT